MASTPVEFEAPVGLTLTLKLYPHGSDTIANGLGDACTEETNRVGTYAASVTEALTGLHHAIILDGSSNLIATYHVDLQDNTSIYRCADLVSGGNDISVSDVLTTQMTEAYAADGTAPTLAQALFLIQQVLTEFSIATTTLTVKKLNGSTTAGTFTLDDATTPTSLTRAS